MDFEILSESVLITMMIVIMAVIMLYVVRISVAEYCKKSGRDQIQGSKLPPPGPRWWPVVGNIFQLGWANTPPHESFSKLASKHGPIMTLWLGSMETVVISSHDVAREMFKNHDAVLAGRKIYEAMRGDFGHEGSLITSQYGPHWRMLRRLCTTEFFVTSRLDAMADMRAKCIDQMMRYMDAAAASDAADHYNIRRRPIDVGRFFFLMGFNLIGNLIFSKDLILDPESDERGAKFFYHADKVMQSSGKPNVADFFPVLKFLDPQSIRRKTQFHVKRAFDVAGEFLKEKMIESNNNNIKKERDYLDVLLNYNSSSPAAGFEGYYYKFTTRTINVIVFEMFTAGTDTTTSTLEWAMAELLRNPKVLKKVQHELRSVIINKKMEEKDIEKLPYLKAVIKETLRLHPPLPFLVPHMAMESCEMLGYHIPKGTQILVNVWAIGRDEKTWEDPLEFKPERFLKPNSSSSSLPDYKGHHFEFIPFGSGRRMCPAVPLVARVLPLALGSVLHGFDWVLEDCVKPEELDMKERMGITLRKAVPLKAIPLPVPHLHILNNECNPRKSIN